MREIVKTNEPVLLSYIEALLRGADIPMMVADQNMSMMEGSIGAFPRRILVDDGDWAAARGVLAQAGLEKWFSEDD